jgi:prophage regulatory protein
MRKDITAAVVSAPSSPSPSHLPPALPSMGFLRQAQLLKFIPISKSTLWRRVQARVFPAPVKLSERVTVWRVEDIRQWIDAQGRQT